MTALLTREAFKVAVLARSSGLCVFCQKPAVDAHHILERKLFSDGGYRLCNGAAVCARHHWDCETTVISTEEVRQACGIESICLPEGFDPAKRYDKWGNEILPDGRLQAGPLAEDVGMQRALKAGNKLWLLTFGSPG